MKAIIAAAGVGKRLLPHTIDRPKSLVPIGGRPLISHTLSALSAAGIKEAVIITGYHAEKYLTEIGRQHAGVRITYVENKEYASTDNLFSLWLARAHMTGGFIFINADVLVESRVFLNLLKNPHGDVCVIDDSKPLAKDAMGMRVEGERVVTLGRNLAGANARAIGIYKYSAAGADLYLAETEQCLAENRRYKIEPPIERFIAKRDLFVERVGKLAWAEIDEPADLESAEGMLGSLTRG